MASYKAPTRSDSSVIFLKFKLRHFSKGRRWWWTLRTLATPLGRRPSAETRLLWCLDSYGAIVSGSCVMSCFFKFSTLRCLKKSDLPSQQSGRFRCWKLKKESNNCLTGKVWGRDVCHELFRMNVWRHKGVVYASWSRSRRWRWATSKRTAACWKSLSFFGFFNCFRWLVWFRRTSKVTFVVLFLRSDVINVIRILNQSTV